MDIVLKYICMPLAINTLKHNRKLQEDNLRIPDPFLNLNDSIIKQLEKDFYELKKDIISKHHLDIRKLEGNKYVINTKERAFSAEELREGAKEIIESYMYGKDADNIKFEDIAAKDTKFNPPDIKEVDNRE